MSEKRKIHSVKVNLSSTFLARAKCLKCDKAIDTYYVSYNAYWNDPRTSNIIFDMMRKFIKKLNSSWYKYSDPKPINSIIDFNVYWEKSFNPRSHSQRAIDPGLNLTEFLSCPCGETVWAFTQKRSVCLPEIKNRKSRYTYPKTAFRH